MCEEMAFAVCLHIGCFATQKHCRMKLRSVCVTCSDRDTIQTKIQGKISKNQTATKLFKSKMLEVILGGQIALTSIRLKESAIMLNAF